MKWINLVAVLAADIDGKPQIAVIIDDALVKSKGLNAGNMVRELAKEIQGGGGGQAFLRYCRREKWKVYQKLLEKARLILILTRPC
jgi:alanyl-tRNA synthetase